MSDPRQDAFLQRIREVLGSDRKVVQRGLEQRHVQPQSPEVIAPLAGRGQDELVQRLIQAGQALHMQVRECADNEAAANALVELAEGRVQVDEGIVAWDHPLIRELELDERLGQAGIDFAYTGWQGSPTTDDERRRQKTRIREQVAQAVMGITSADFCLADTATLVMKTRPGHARSASLVPETHAAVIRREQIIADLGQLYFLLTHEQDQIQEGLSNCLSLISGPSKTADIELCMVYGVHGPREVHLFVLP
ncbi:MAG: lactate utilization protein [Desulfovermiculus sp.]